MSIQVEVRLLGFGLEGLVVVVGSEVEVTRAAWVGVWASSEEEVVVGSGASKW